MILELTPEQQAFKQSVEAFAREVVAPRAAAIDESGEFPLDVMRAAAGRGPARRDHPEGLGRRRARLRQLRAGDRSDRAGERDGGGVAGRVTTRWSPSCIAHAGRAPAEGAVAAAAGVAARRSAPSRCRSPTPAPTPRTRRRRRCRTATGYRITGRKVWVANAEAAAVAIVFACTRPGLRGQGVTAFLVPMDTPGITRTARADSLGVRGLGCMDLDFDIEVGDDQVLGSGRPGIPPRDVGAAGRPRRDCRAGARHRRGGDRRGDRVRQGARTRSASRSRTTRRFSGCWPTWRPSSKRRGC